MPSGAIPELVQGCARDADVLAADWAKVRGVCCVDFPVHWKAHQEAAGPMCNQKLLDYGLSILVAFPVGNGTKGMGSRTVTSGVRILRVQVAEDVMSLAATGASAFHRSRICSARPAALSEPKLRLSSGAT